MHQTTAALPVSHRSRVPYAKCALVGLGGLFAGVTGPLLSTFVPILVAGVLGEHRAAIGAVMAIDNVLLLLLVPAAGALSDRTVARGGSRVPLVVAAFVLAAVGMSVLPASSRYGLTGLVLSMVLLYTGLNLQRAPFQALVADLIPSKYRSLGTASVTFQMCVGAIAFLMLGRALGMRVAFLVAAATVVAIGAAAGLFLRAPETGARSATEAPLASLAGAVVSAVRGELPGLRAVFVSAFLLQLTFQTFTTWFSLHGTERFGMRPEDVALGFVAWAVGGVLGRCPLAFSGCASDGVEP